MHFLLFLRGLLGVLIVFAIATYVVTGSPWTTFVQTVICAVLLQVGYFAAILFLVWRSGGKRAGEGSAPPSETAQSPEQQAGDIGRLPGVPRTPHP